MTTETMREAVKGALRQHIKCDATGLAPAVAGVFLVGFEDAADAAIRTVLERLMEVTPAMGSAGMHTLAAIPDGLNWIGLMQASRDVFQSMLDAAAREVG